MSDDATRYVRKDGSEVSVELVDEKAENGFMTMKFSEVRLLPNGWVEGREPEDEEERVNFFPPWKVQNIFVYDEDKPSATF